MKINTLIIPAFMVVILWLMPSLIKPIHGLLFYHKKIKRLIMTIPFNLLPTLQKLQQSTNPQKLLFHVPLFQ